MSRFPSSLQRGIEADKREAAAAAAVVLLVPPGSTAPGSFHISLLLDLNGSPHALGILTRKVFIPAEVSGLLLF